MMMTLGTFVFSLPTLAYQQLQASQTWRYAASERVGDRAALQFLGPGEDTIELSGVIAPEITGDLGSLNTLRWMASEGESLPLVDGTGVVYGDYVITGIDETGTLFFSDGIARRTDFKLALKRAPNRDGQTLNARQDAESTESSESTESTESST